MKTLQSRFPKVKEGASCYHGGDQHWYEEKYGQDAGCGAVAAANALASLALKHDAIADAFGLIKDEDGAFEKEAYLRFMEEVFACVGSWHFFGKATGVGITRLILMTLRFAKSKGVYLNVRSCSAPFIGEARLRSFIKEGLIVSSSLILPAGWNNFVVTYEDGRRAKISRHFVSISGISEDEKVLHISTWGRSATITLKELHASLQSPFAIDTALLYFKPALCVEETNKALLKAGMPLLSTVRSAIFRF